MRILDPAQRRFYRRDIIFRQIARVGPRISDDFEALVKLLGDLQCALGTEAATVRVALQTGQIVKKRRRLGCRFPFFGGNAGFADASALDFVSRRFVPNPLGSRVFVAVFREIFPEPATAISAGFDREIAEYLIIVTRLEVVNSPLQAA